MTFMNNLPAWRSVQALARRWAIPHGHLILGAAAVLTLVHNAAFWGQLFQSYPFATANLWFQASVAACLFAVTALLLSLFDVRLLLKPALVVFFLAASGAAYFMDTYGVVIDHDMLRNAAQTNSQETLDLLNLRFLGYVLGLGVLPSLAILLAQVRWPDTFRSGLGARFRRAGILLGVLAVSIVPLGRTWASFLREHKAIRQYANPGFLAYSAVKFGLSGPEGSKGPVRPLGEDARIPATDKGRELLIVVVGESARADHFSLNGYGRETNPELSRLPVISFTNVHAEATSTATAVPMMFSPLDPSDFSVKRARASENLLDVLRHAGVNVLWRDNNSDSKGVADRIPYEDFKTDRNPDMEGGEPRDEGMLAGLQAYIDGHPKGDIVIVLHQMGNHGPAYYKRYPPAFEHFKPVRKTSELGDCSPEEIANAYDNAIRYTDHFLAAAIRLLERNKGKFEAGLLYWSDHGESLGEKGVYLHGMPPFMAPDEQKHVASLFWFADSFEIDTGRFRRARDLPLTHANLFHTVLGLLEIESQVYDPRKDIARLIDPSSPALAQHSGVPQPMNHHAN